MKRCQAGLEVQCLVAWASAHVGGESFNQWCFRQGFHPMTGTRRKDRALEHICRALGGCMIQHNENGLEGVLIDTPEISHVADSLAVLRSEADGIVSWAADDAFLPFQSDAQHDFSWAAKRNERRRQREARRRRKRWRLGRALIVLLAAVLLALRLLAVRVCRRIFVCVTRWLLVMGRLRRRPPRTGVL